MQSGGIIVSLRESLTKMIFMAGLEGAKTVVKKYAPKLAKNVAKYYVNRGINKVNKEFTASESSGITLTNNLIKDIIKVINSLKNRGILMQGTTEKVVNQKGRFSDSLMRIGSPLVKNVLTSLAKNLLLP